MIKLESNENSRIYLDYQTPREATIGLIALYEELLKQKNHSSSSLTYSMSELFAFLDNLAELTLLM